MKTTEELTRQLLTAALAGDDAAINRLLADGVDVNTTSEDGWTALMLAARKTRPPSSCC